jgi:acyl-CoA reductase-like NAD-dependent aldehyde dehydrogenase
MAILSSLLPVLEQSADELVSRAVAAQQAFESWDDYRVDALLGGIAQRIDDHAADLASATVTETQLGNVADKTTKNRLASQGVYRSLVGKVGSGVLQVDHAARVVEIASPMGVVLGLVPMTHPVATFVFKVLIALKSRNAIVLSPHRGAQNVANQTGDLIQAVLLEHGAPEHLVQWVRMRSGRQKTMELMTHPDVAFILATGGAEMVRAAYSSGKPTIGVGPGNAPTWIREDSDPRRVAADVIASKTFDYGTACASEHNLVVNRAIAGAVLSALEERGVAIVQPRERARVLPRIFDRESGHVRQELVGQSAARIAEEVGLHREFLVRLIVVPASPEDVDSPLGHEKLAPVLSLFVARDDEHALELCARLLEGDGRGHTAIVHTTDQVAIQRFAREMRVSRILVNAPGLQGSIGMGTGLIPSMTLGTGTFGGTSTTDNVTYTHLRNVKRVAFGASVPGAWTAQARCSG